MFVCIAATPKTASFLTAHQAIALVVGLVGGDICEAASSMPGTSALHHVRLRAIHGHDDEYPHIANEIGQILRKVSCRTLQLPRRSNHSKRGSASGRYRFFGRTGESELPLEISNLGSKAFVRLSAAPSNSRSVTVPSWRLHEACFFPVSLSKCLIEAPESVIVGLELNETRFCRHGDQRANSSCGRDDKGRR